MNLIRKDFLQAVKFILPAIGTKESRKNLMNMHAQCLNGKAVFTGADAYRIKRISLQPITQSRFKPFMIPRKMLIYYRQMLNQSKAFDCDVTRTDLSVDGYGVTYQQPEVEYPNLEKLISGPWSTSPDPGSVIGLNTEMMRGVMAEFPNKQYSPVKVLFGKGESPVVKFVTMDGMCESIIMPVRINW